jgi:hypothetical protein
MTDDVSANYSTKLTEADMRGRFIDPVLDGKYGVWPSELIDREHPYDLGELIPEWGTGKTKRNEPKKKPDYVLRFSDDDFEKYRLENDDLVIQKSTYN